MADFYNLGGNTIAEHKRNFNRYVSNLYNLNTDDAIQIIRTLQPRNLQEQIFHLKLLSKFEQYEILLNNLYNGNRILNKITIRNSKFCKYIVDNVKPTDFVENICSNVSYVTRINLMNNMSWVFENPADEHFEAIREIYGLREALIILPCCTRSLIEAMLNETKCTIKGKHLIKLHQKFPGFIKFYFETTHDFMDEHKELCLYLIYNDPKAVDAIPPVGKRSFRKYFHVRYHEIIEEPNKYTKYLKIIKNEIRSKSISFDLVFKNLFPEKQDRIHSIDVVLPGLKLYTKQMRASKFLETYKEKYGNDYSSESVNKNLLEVMDAKDCAIFNNNNTYIEYNTLDYSIPQIKSKINLTSDMYERASLLEKLILTCKINNSTDGLLEVLKYICDRHKNDNSSVKERVLFTISNNYNLSELSEEHWKYLKQILLILKVHGNPYYHITKFLKHMILMKIRKNLDYTEELTEYLQNSLHYRNWNVLEEFPKLQREIWLKYPDVFGEIKDVELMELKMSYLYNLMEYNKNNKKLAISPYNFPDIINQVFSNLETDSNNYKIYDFIAAIFDHTEDVNEKLKIAQKYLSMDSYHTKDNIYNWCLKYKPETLLTYVDSVLNNYEDANFYYELCKMHYTKLPQVFIDLASKKFYEEDLRKVQKVLNLLSYQTNYLDLLKKYPPQIIDISQTDASRVFELNRNILISLKNAFIPSKTLETVFMYCQKDYLRYALESLYFVSYHTKGSYFEQVILQLLDRSVSVRKHAIFLNAKLSKLSTILSLLSSVSKTEKNASIKKFIFQSTFGIFRKNPIDRIFNLLVENLNLLDIKNDAESRELIYNVQSFPDKFQPKYIQILWNYLKEKDPGSQFQVVEKINKELIPKLTKSFCDEILTSVVLQRDCVNDFAYYYLIYSQDLELFWKTVENYMNAPYENHMGLGTKLNNASNLFKYFASNLIREEKESASKTLSANLVQGFKELNISANIAYIQLILELSNHYVQFGLLPFEQFLISKQKDYHESEMLEMYWECAKTVFDNVLYNYDWNKNQLDIRMQVLEEILAVDSGHEAKLLVLHFMPKANIKDFRNIQRINAMLDIIMKDKNNVIDVFYTKYITQCI